MTIALPSRAPSSRTSSGRSTRVYEFFDARSMGHLWFVAVCDEEAVQMLAPTFRTERAARVFEYCYLYHPSGFLLSIDSQLELGYRIERKLALEPLSGEAALRILCEGLAFENQRTEGHLTRTSPKPETAAVHFASDLPLPDGCSIRQ